jgi:hypothetical protein
LNPHPKAACHPSNLIQKNSMAFLITGRRENTRNSVFFESATHLAAIADLGLFAYGKSPRPSNRPYRDHRRLPTPVHFEISSRSAQRLQVVQFSVGANTIGESIPVEMPLN